MVWACAVGMCFTVLLLSAADPSFRLDNLAVVADHLLREGMLRAGLCVLKLCDMPSQGMVDVSVYQEVFECASGLRAHDTTKALQWVKANASRLRRIEVSRCGGSLCTWA